MSTHYGITTLKQNFNHVLLLGVKEGGAQSRIPLFSPTFWNSYPAYQKKHISNLPYPIAFPNLEIPHIKKFNDKILQTKNNERQILLSRFLFGLQHVRLFPILNYFQITKRPRGFIYHPFRNAVWPRVIPLFSIAILHLNLEKLPSSIPLRL